VTQGVTWASGGSYTWQIADSNGTAGSGWDLLGVGVALNITASSVSPFTINLWSLSGTNPDVSGQAANFDATQNHVWKIANASSITGFAANAFTVVTGSVNGTGGFANGVAGGTFSVAQNGNEIDLVFTKASAPPPPPSTITINVPTGSQTQGQAGYASLSGTTPVEKTGVGIAVLDTANTLTGPTTVSQGTLQLGNAAALSSSAVTVAAGATLSVGPQVQATVPSLVNNGLVDVGLGRLTVGAGLSTTDLVNGIIEIINGGTTGITSSGIAAAAGSRAVGWLDNGDGSFTFGFAAQGDTDLDGQVGLGDLINILSSAKYGTGEAAAWSEGDFNYDGAVDLSDLIDILSTGVYGQGDYNPASPSFRIMSLARGGSAGSFGGGLLLGSDPSSGLTLGNVAAVPEPSAWVLSVTAGIGVLLMVRRRRRTSVPYPIS
ncbi:MAG: autotransporter-associated beta strand repeat-containing protein, partial [Planctomycetota bacterium]